MTLAPTSRVRATPLADGSTVLSGAVVDQAALHGLLQKVRDIGLPIVSVTYVEPHDPE